LDPREFTLIEHLTELRYRLLIALGAIALTMVASLAFAPDLLDVAVRPLRRVMASAQRVNVVEWVASVPDNHTLEERLSDDARVRWLGSANSLDELKNLYESHDGKQRVDLVFVDAQVVGPKRDRLTHWMDTLEDPPALVYLVDVSGSSEEALELLVEGETVLKRSPSTGALKLVIRRAAQASGKVVSGDRLVVLSPLDPFFAYMKIALVCGLFMACPVWLYQTWRFVAPGLYSHERRFVVPVVVSGSVLFVSGGLFAYLLMFPMMFDVLVNQMMPDSLIGTFTVEKYLSFLLQVTVAFGAVFELPLVLTMLAMAGIVDAGQLARFRKYAYVLAFVIGAILTPADPISQTMMAVPLVVFYEVGVFAARVVGNRRRERAALVA
jgi:sec-independent protein translocase protein TatC